jgi:hypothetical protein
MYQNDILDRRARCLGDRVVGHSKRAQAYEPSFHVVRDHKISGTFFPWDDTAGLDVVICVVISSSSNGRALRSERRNRGSSPREGAGAMVYRQDG